MESKIIAQIRESGAKILIADDEEVIRESLRRMGEMLGFEVHTAVDGNDAWETFMAIWPDFAILDIYMPKVNGLVLLNRIKDVNAQCQVILITGYMHFKQLSKQSPMKPDGFITKPFSLEDIVARIFKLMPNTRIMSNLENQ
ncbi:response regulator [bacterium]|nr:response regulator [bacterium]MBU1880746.1 response regulator [bacterium]